MLHNATVLYSICVYVELRTYLIRYDNCCRYLTSDQIEENLSNEKPFVIRLKLLYQYQEFDDELYGHIKHNMHSEGDPVLLKSDGYEV